MPEYNDSSRDPFDWSNDRLLSAFTRACAEAGVSGSGLVIDLMAGENVQYATFLRKVVASRLDGVTPPFRKNDKVKPKRVPLLGVDDLRWIEHYSWKPRKDMKEKEYTIRDVLYEGRGVWIISLEEIFDKSEWYEGQDMERVVNIKRWYFKPEDFDKVQSEVLAIA